jgi:ABC-2 type transport system permease protein
MKTILLIARRELAAYLRSWTGYVIIALVLALDGVLFNALALTNGEHRSGDVLSYFFFLTSGLVMISSVLISMRLVAEERQTGTIALLYSSPVRESEIVIGKFLSALGLMAIMTLATVYMPLLIKVHGKISWGHMFGGYLGLLLLGSASLAIGTFGSALARSQVLAAIISGVMMAVIVTLWFVARATDRPFSEILGAVALWQLHFQPFMAGVVHLRDVIYYLAVTYVFLFAATRVLEARRWR